jgi:hypothetical protein
VSSDGYNLIGFGELSYVFDSPGDVTNVSDPGLSPLADNGGPTLTHSLMPSSPAVDSGDPTLVVGSDAPEFDQRGIPFQRIVGERMDKGALERIPDPSIDGDFNDDGVYDCDDIDALVFALASLTTDRAFDLTGDGIIDDADLDAWLSEAGEANLGPNLTYLPGDANLDGRVDVADFNIWNAHKFSLLTVLPGWCQGNFNADSLVDVRDFNVWNANRFQGTTFPALAAPRLHDRDAIRHAHADGNELQNRLRRVNAYVSDPVVISEPLLML